MKSPNEFNIDEWLFRYFEGDLTPEDESMLEEFLLENPHYDAQFEAWGAARVQEENIEYPNQQKILKPVVSFRFFHKAAVFIAIAINIVLASFIIFGDRNYQNQYALVELHPELFKVNDSDDAQFTYSASNDDHQNFGIQRNGKIQSISSIEPSINNFQTNLQLRAFNVQYRSQSSINAGSNQTGALNVSFNALLNSDLEDSGNEPLHNSSHSLYNLSNSNNGLIGNQVFQSETESDIISRNLASTTTEIETKKFESYVEFSENSTKQHVETNQSPENHIVESNNSLASDVKSTDSKEQKISESTQKDGKHANGNESKGVLKSFKFRGGETLLTNTRTQEYLIPGANRNQINFAHVGSDLSNSVYSNSFAQWPGRNNQMFVNQLGYDMFVPQIKSGLGFQVMYSSYGQNTIRDIETSLTYSPKFILSKNFMLEPAVRFRMSTTGVNRSHLTPGSMIEYDRGNTFQYSQQQQDLFVNRSIQQDLGIGVMLNSRWGYAGINADNLVGNLNEAVYYGSEQNLQRAPIFLNAVLGTEYLSSDKKTLWSGQLIYQKHGDLSKIWLGSRIKLNYISLGASVSSMGEPMFSAGLVTKSLSIYYSGDYSYSRMYNDRFLSHQILMRITLKESRMKKLLLN